MREFLYDYRKPPIMVRTPMSPFICKQCGLPGIGSYNAKVHPGECRRLWGNAISRRHGKSTREQKAAEG